MRAMILAAGLGTRLKPFTDFHPKALAMVNGKSLLQRNIEYLQAFGINEVVVNVHHFADQIMDAVERNKGWGSQVFISDESSEVLETGGGLLFAKYFFAPIYQSAATQMAVRLIQINELSDNYFYKSRQPFANHRQKLTEKIRASIYEPNHELFLNSTPRDS
jgi:bifunctional N-acetylglucosamine-1-phosphate-uridyltransferase/glucosamine-1-phosphate-acetyltransferase GlmU-like protein